MSEPEKTPGFLGEAYLLDSDDIASAEFCSILFDGLKDETQKVTIEEPLFFRDLNLDQVVNAITNGWKEYQLEPFFYTQLTSLTAISYRHEILRDLENESLFQRVRSFAEQMRAMREHVRNSENLYYKYQKERWFLNAAEVYCETVETLLAAVRQAKPTSRGFVAFQEHLARYVESAPFAMLCDETKKLTSALTAIRYSLLIRGNNITVRPYDSETDYSAVIEEEFSKFKQGGVKNYLAKFSASATDMNHVEAQVLELVAKLNPDLFHALDSYCSRNKRFAKKAIVDFDREIQFYISYLAFIEKFKHAGLQFCYPRVSDVNKEVSSRDGFDLALAEKLTREKAAIVCNDFFLKDDERIFVVSGPNQGGKTTFARTFGQLHYLANLGLVVPGSDAQLFLYDELFTHFEKEEDIETHRGKLQDDLIRSHHILERATANSVIIMNEIFSSTTLKDAAFLSKKMVEQISQLGALCVCVTFIDELSRLNEKTVSVVATIVPGNPTQRTHKIVRMPADGLSYTRALAEKYGLTHEQLTKRLRRLISS